MRFSALAAAALACGLASPVFAADNAPRGGTLSGLPWASGASAGSMTLQDARGDPLDVRTTYLSTKAWPEMVASASWVKTARAGGAQPVVALGLMPATHRGQHAQCAQGQFDAYIRQIGARLVAYGGANAILRLGWEANRMNGFPWAVTGDGQSYRQCFRRWVKTLRAVPGQKFTIDWNMARQGNLPYSVAKIYPGNDVVDLIGVQVYDTCLPNDSEADWLKNQNATRNGGPAGLLTWHAFAKSRGKRLSVPEWGVGGTWRGCREAAFDNPFFIERMRAFFAANATTLAYEAYLNGPGAAKGNPDTAHPHTIAPAEPNPASAAAYVAAW